MSRVLAIGDVHGCSRALATLLAAIDPRPEDLVVTLGDYVDRGPDSKGVLEQLIALRERTTLVPLIGNHDQMMLEAREGRGCDWLVGYGVPTLASYGLEAAELEEVPPAHWAFLEGWRDWFETESHRPLDLGHMICIDTYAHGGRWLTCLEVSSRWAWQADQSGALVSGRLEELAQER